MPPPTTAHDTERHYCCSIAVFVRHFLNPPRMRLLAPGRRIECCCTRLLASAVAVLTAGGCDTGGGFLTLPPGERLVTPADGRSWYLGQLEAPAPAHLYIANAGGVAARVAILFYTPGDRTEGRTLEVPPRSVVEEAIDSCGDGTAGDVCWLAVTSDQPVLPQLISEDPGMDGAPETLTTVLPKAGPLGREYRATVFPDGFQGGAEDWYEQERLTLLNPGPAIGLATITVVSREGGRKRSVEVPMRASGVTVVDLWRIFGRGTSPQRPGLAGDFTVRVQADRPVLSQLTRTARHLGREAVGGRRATLPVPERTAAAARLWYYAGGWIRERGLPPRDEYTARTWQLLFATGVRRPATVRTRPVAPAGGGPSIDVPAGRSTLVWLNNPPWLDLLGLDRPWALTLEPDAPIVASMSTGEFGDEGVFPDAMGAAALVPGPLTGDTDLWLGVAREGRAVAAPAVWESAWQFFNTGMSPVDVTLQAYGTGAPGAQVLSVGPGGVVRFRAADWPGFPRDTPVGVRARANGPVVGHTWVRVLPATGTRTRALWSSPGVPLALAPVR